MKKDQDEWAMRRGFMFGSSAFCCAIIVWILGAEMETEPAEVAMSMAFLTLMANVGYYVAGATWEYVATRKK